VQLFPLTPNQVLKSFEYFSLIKVFGWLILGFLVLK